MDFTGRIGGINSQIGFVALGYDAMDEVVVTWIRNSHPDDNSQEMEFGFDEAGNSIVLVMNVPTVLTRAQAQQAQVDGAVLVSMTVI